MAFDPMSITIWIVILVLSAVGGYYVTRGVLSLAQRRASKEETDRAQQIGDGGPALAAESAVAEDAESAAESAAESVSPESTISAASPTSSAEAQEGPDGVQAKAGLRGGMWIGILERVLITAFFMTGFTTGIAVVVAVKGLGRYPELNAATSERFIIGTLASLLWAFACGSLGLWLIHSL
ncbi:hypothetical protein [Timonella senegalensis]|uniref:hypothetical protein n=1 Tax=Timonella senegalensis TaxID=1465825 RepID=UPI0028A8B6C4|nr:hypothetical protein [Timonella senegalensis]